MSFACFIGKTSTGDCTPSTQSSIARSLCAILFWQLRISVIMFCIICSRLWIMPSCHICTMLYSKRWMNSRPKQERIHSGNSSRANSSNWLELIPSKRAHCNDTRANNAKRKQNQNKQFLLSSTQQLILLCENNSQSSINTRLYTISSAENRRCAKKTKTDNIQRMPIVNRAFQFEMNVDNASS